MKRAIENRDSLKSVSAIPISSGGYEELKMFTPIMTVSDYIDKSSPYYCELLILPDGRVLPAEPSHTMLIESIICVLTATDYKALLENLSIPWYREELLALSGVISVWKEQQEAITPELTKGQRESLRELSEAGLITLNVRGLFPNRESMTRFWRETEI